MPSRRSSSLAGLALLVFAAAAHGQNMIPNGGFEDPSVPAEDVDGGILFIGPTFIPGDWNLSAGSADILRRHNATPYQVPEGSQAIDLTGQGTRGTLRRTLGATGNTIYRLSFWLSGNPTCEQGIKRINFLLENTIFAQLNFNTTGRSPTNMGWTKYEYTFPGLPEPRFVQFQSTTGTNCGAMLDDVRLEKCLEVTANPLSQERCEGAPAIFSVDAAGTAPQYRWRKGTVTLADGGNVSGATTSTLVLASASPSDAGEYSCLVFDECGELFSGSAVLTVAPPSCPGDANGDRIVNFQDITKVLEFWNFNYAPGTGPGDSDCDGSVDFGEITLVLAAFGAACDG